MIHFVKKCLWTWNNCDTKYECSSILVIYRFGSRLNSANQVVHLFENSFRLRRLRALPIVKTTFYCWHKKMLYWFICLMTISTCHFIHRCLNFWYTENVPSVLSVTSRGVGIDILTVLVQILMIWITIINWNILPWNMWQPSSV